MKKSFCFILIFLFSVAGVSARTFVVEEVGVSVVFPDNWTEGKKDGFGYLILPQMGANEKIRIHVTSYRDMTAKEAVLKSVEKVNAIRKEQKQPLEKLFSSTPIITQSGIQGERGAIGPDRDDAKPYLYRYYFQKPEGTFFCVCVYFYDNEAFAKTSEKAIIDTLSFSKR